MRIPSRRRAFAAAVLTPVLLVGATACGGDDTEPTSSDTSAEAPDTAEEPADDATQDETSEETDEPAAAEGDEVSDPEAVFAEILTAMQDARTATVSMDMGIGSAEGVMSYGEGAPEMALTMNLGDAGLGNMEMRLVDEKVFMSMPGITPAGKFIELTSDIAGMGDLVDEFAGMTPEASLDMLAESLVAMTEVGEENIGGEDTTRYTLTVDTEASMDLAGELGGEAIPNMPETLDYDMWVTEDNLIRRISMEVMGAGVQLDYTNWGEPVDIVAPTGKDIVKTPKGL